MAFSMGWRGITWMGVTVERRFAGEKDCRLLANMVSSWKPGAWSKVQKGRLYISTSHTSTMYFINNAIFGSRCPGGRIRLLLVRVEGNEASAFSQATQFFDCA
jgi:hypothetical protein